MNKVIPQGVITGAGHIDNGPGWPCQIVTTVDLIDISTGAPKPDPKWTLPLGHRKAAA